MLQTQKKTLKFRFIAYAVILCFIFSSLNPACSYAQSPVDLGLPAPGAMMSLSSAYVPVIAKGLRVHPENPILFDMIMDTGNDVGAISNRPYLKTESEKLIKYFLAALTIPDNDLWVNLSPYEKDRIIKDELGQTEMGRDMLAQDYILKQMTASLIDPKKQLGKEFWSKIYAKAHQLYGTSDIPVNTFNKVWIVAEKANIYVHDNTAYVTASHLRVMLEEDYLSLQKHSNVGAITNRSQDTDTHALASQIVREIVLPALENEVNQGKNFANLRQIFHSMILAAWYKKNLKEALLNQVYSDKSKVHGVDVEDKTIKEQIYQEYLKAYKKGVFNYIKEDLVNGQTIPRKYFSGGLAVNVTAAMKQVDATQAADDLRNNPAMGQLFEAEFATPGEGHWSDGLAALEKKRARSTSEIQESEEADSLRVWQEGLSQRGQIIREALEIMARDHKRQENTTRTREFYDYFHPFYTDLSYGRTPARPTFEVMAQKYGVTNKRTSALWGAFQYRLFSIINNIREREGLITFAESQERLKAALIDIPLNPTQASPAQTAALISAANAAISLLLEDPRLQDPILGSKEEDLRDQLIALKDGLFKVSIVRPQGQFLGGLVILAWTALLIANGKNDLSLTTKIAAILSSLAVLYSSLVQWKGAKVKIEWALRDLLDVVKEFDDGTPEDQQIASRIRTIFNAYPLKGEQTASAAMENRVTAAKIGDAIHQLIRAYNEYVKARELNQAYNVEQLSMILDLVKRSLDHFSSFQPTQGQILGKLNTFDLKNPTQRFNYERDFQALIEELERATSAAMSKEEGLKDSDPIEALFGEDRYSIRAKNSLSNLGIETIGQLREKTYFFIFVPKYRNFGDKSKLVVKKALERHSIVLQGEKPKWWDQGAAPIVDKVNDEDLPTFNKSDSIDVLRGYFNIGEARIENLKANHIELIGDLERISRKGLEKIRNWGKDSLDGLERMINKNNVKLLDPDEYLKNLEALLGSPEVDDQFAAAYLFQSKYGKVVTFLKNDIAKLQRILSEKGLLNIFKFEFTSITAGLPMPLFYENSWTLIEHSKVYNSSLPMLSFGRKDEKNVPLFYLQDNIVRNNEGFWRFEQTKGGQKYSRINTERSFREYFSDLAIVRRFCNIKDVALLLIKAGYEKPTSFKSIDDLVRLIQEDVPENDGKRQLDQEKAVQSLIGFIVNNNFTTYEKINFKTNFVKELGNEIGVALVAFFVKHFDAQWIERFNLIGDISEALNEYDVFQVSVRDGVEQELLRRRAHEDLNVTTERIHQISTGLKFESSENNEFTLAALAPNEESSFGKLSIGFILRDDHIEAQIVNSLGEAKSSKRTKKWNSTNRPSDTDKLVKSMADLAIKLISELHDGLKANNVVKVGIDFPGFVDSKGRKVGYNFVDEAYPYLNNVALGALVASKINDLTRIKSARDASKAMVVDPASLNLIDGFPNVLGQGSVFIYEFVEGWKLRVASVADENNPNKFSATLSNRVDSWQIDYTSPTDLRDKPLKWEDVIKTFNEVSPKKKVPASATVIARNAAMKTFTGAGTDRLALNVVARNALTSLAKELRDTGRTITEDDQPLIRKHIFQSIEETRKFFELTKQEFAEVIFYFLTDDFQTLRTRIADVKKVAEGNLAILPLVIQLVDLPRFVAKAKASVAESSTLIGKDAFYALPKIIGRTITDKDYLGYSGKDGEGKNGIRLSFLERKAGMTDEIFYGESFQGLVLLEDGRVYYIAPGVKMDYSDKFQGIVVTNEGLIVGAKVKGILEPAAFEDERQKFRVAYSSGQFHILPSNPSAAMAQEALTLNRLHSIADPIIKERRTSGINYFVNGIPVGTFAVQARIPFEAPGPDSSSGSYNASFKGTAAAREVLEKIAEAVKASYPGLSSTISEVTGPDAPAGATLLILSFNAAMSKELVQGGIDLNSKNMTLQESGDRLQIKFDPAMIREFKRGDFSGIRPVIINITPIASIFPILGLKEPEENELLAKA